jgi:CRP/FNR family transcriptional regulator, cyclic AMP receptor protein
MASTSSKLTDLEAAMAATPAFQGIPPDAVRRFAAQGAARHFRRSTYICHQGDPADDVYFLVDGRVEVSSESTTGTRVYHATIDTPQFIGELGVLGEMPRTATMLALIDSSVWASPGEAFLEIVSAEPMASRAMLRALARGFADRQSFVEDLLFLDLKGRLAKRLLQMVTPDLDFLPEDGSVVPDVTQADLASMCGGSRENVTRILKEFERRGLVKRDGHRYVLKKVAGLAKIADL